MFNYSIFVFFFYIVGFKSDDNQTIEILKNQGYSDIKLKGTDIFACDRNDKVSNKFTAIGMNGSAITGVVCCGALLKACTVRIISVENHAKYR